jgi:hypothetical protein
VNHARGHVHSQLHQEVAAQRTVQRLCAVLNLDTSTLKLRFRRCRFRHRCTCAARLELIQGKATGDNRAETTVRDGVCHGRLPEVVGQSGYLDNINVAVSGMTTPKIPKFATRQEHVRIMQNLPFELCSAAPEQPRVL